MGTVYFFCLFKDDKIELGTFKAKKKKTKRKKVLILQSKQKLRKCLLGCTQT